jgi:hypothetical protein
MCAEFTPRVFANLAIGNADDIGFGVAPHPVRCGLRLELGSGKVYPEVSFTLPAMELTEASLPRSAPITRESGGRSSGRNESACLPINHRTPDRAPIDFGGSAVTGMHVSCVKLRDHYGLERRLVKVTEPFQMGHVYDKQSYGLV